MAKKKTTSLAMSDETKAAIKIAADKDRRSMSSWVEVQLRKILKLDEPETPKT